MYKINMGLLTDPTIEEIPKKTFILKHYAKLNFFMVFSSVIWLVMQAHDDFSASTYFSENALLPGLVQSKYSGDKDTRQFYMNIEAEAKKYPNSIPGDWLVEQFRNIHLEAYIQNYTLNNPLKEKVKFLGSNVYAILRAPRSSSLEALVLSVPYRSYSSIYPPTNAGLAIMFSLAKYFRKQKYWAKDIIFLVTEHEQLGMQAWLDAYHGTTSGVEGVVNHGILEEHSGAIQAAINMEIHEPKINNIDVKISGLNGQLPNLDLVNLIHRLCTKEGVRSTFHNKDSRTSRFPSWKEKLLTMFNMMAIQATGVPDGNHGLFHRYGIEALTIEGHSKNGRGSASFHHVGRVTEGIFRSLNNLLERFHQSFFFYLLPSTDRYVSIGLYMPSIALLVTTLYLKSFAAWLNIDGKIMPVKNSTVLLPRVNLNIMVVSSLVLACHIIGYFIMPIGRYLVQELPWKSEMSLTIIYFAFSFLSVILIAVFMNMLINPNNWVMLHVICLIELATFLMCISMHNFSFGYAVALIYVFPTLWISTTNNRWFKKFIWIIFHPYLILYWLTLITTACTFPEYDLSKILQKSFDAIQHLIALNVTDAMIYGNWTFTVTNLVLLPTWLSFWALLNSRSTVEELSISQSNHDKRFGEESDKKTK